MWRFIRICEEVIRYQWWQNAEKLLLGIGNDSLIQIPQMIRQQLELPRIMTPGLRSIFMGTSWFY